MRGDGSELGRTARALIRAAGRAVLSTGLRDAPAAPEAWPYGSLVMVACDHDGSPLLLLSDLAEHSRNIAASDRVSLLIDATEGFEDPLEGPRLTLLGRARKSGLPGHRTRYLARHPQAGRYADFGDFAFYRVELERAHLIEGFGRIEWIEGEDLLFDIKGAEALAQAEAGIVAHMNSEHGDAIGLYAKALLGRSGEGWTMTGVDPEGCDLVRGETRARLAFDNPVRDADSARAELVRLARAARSGSGAS